MFRQVIVRKRIRRRNRITLIVPWRHNHENAEKSSIERL
jgi:hypothetical protein